MKNKIFLIVIFFILLVSNIFPQILFRSGIFLHHSSGGVIWNSSSPNVPQLMNMYNTEHNYTGNNAVTMDIDSDHFPPLPDGNYYDTWHAVFVGQYDPTVVAQMQQHIQNNSIVVIKTCWGAGPVQMGNPADTLVIEDYETGRTYFRAKWHWRSIIREMQSHPDNFFVIWTSIPSVPGSGFDGTIAHRFFTWAKDTLATGNDSIFGNFPDNVYVFDAFHLLADPNILWGMSPLYHDEGDNHPNEAGANAVAEPFVWETFDAAIPYETGGGTFQLTVPIQNHWNMVSISGLHPTDQNVSTWWQFRDPGASVFKFAGGYTGVTTAVPGTGYWMKHTGDRIYDTGDEWPAGGIHIVAHYPITAQSGWNLIGGYELVVETASITTNPPGLQIGPVYSYAGGYQIATTLDPGYGYWIKLSAAGQIIFSEVLAKGNKPVVYFPEDWGKIIITDNAGKHCILYGVKGEVNLNEYELPPAPPTGMFDIRFGSGRFAENLNSCINTIEMNGIEYPVTVKVENMSIKIEDEGGKIVSEILKTGEEVIINNSLSKLLVSTEVITDKYSLGQNYPNPFNPETTIRFSISESGIVKLTIYDILGQEIRTLVNEFKESGVYTINFNASELNSGIYIYKIETNGFIQTRKMVLVK